MLSGPCGIASWIVGYEFYVTRADHWSDGKPEIPKEEWLDLVVHAPELSLAGYHGPYFALWSGDSKYGADAWFNWKRGQVHTKNPDPPMIVKALQIAERLRARVQGDDGEIYLPDGRVQVNGVVDEHPEMDWRTW